MALIVPSEASETPRAAAWLDKMVAGNGPIRRVLTVDVRESMANGGGPACLRLRVLADPASIDPRFLVDEAKLDRIAECVERHWPERIAIDDLADPSLSARIEGARTALLDLLGLAELAD
jgi:succinylarginine dihydrolase